MDITYLGHSSFKLRSTNAMVVTDPYNKSVGFSLSKVGADVVTISHDHDDHNNASAVTGTSRREKPFIINSPGEYEVGGISVFGFSSYHDDKKGEERGGNTVYSILIDGLNIVHLGDLGHTLSDAQVSELGEVDVLLCPVGGHYTVGPKQVSQIVSSIEPLVLIPMHYKTPEHDAKTFESLVTLEEFLKEFGGEYKTTDKLTLSKAAMPTEMEVIVLEK